MAPDAFPQFLSLPKEIQILIWEAAVRPVPGNRHVHRFYIANYHLNGPHQFRPIKGRFVQLLPTRQNVRYFGTTYSGGLNLAVPLDDPDSNPNDSVYLTDSSLWTVCKDSRQAMERRFTKNEWWSHVKSPYHPKRTATHGQYFGQKGATHTASYSDDNGGFRHITIDVEQDLIHLDPRHLNRINWWNNFGTDFLCLFDRRTESSPEAKPSFLGPNIALDYDRSIMDMLTDRMKHYRHKHFHMYSGNFIDMLGEIYDLANRTIWFIDYELVPIGHIAKDGPELPQSHESIQQNEKQVQRSEESREIFRSGDCVYTEVKRQDIGVRWEITKNDEAWDGDNSTAFDMLDHLTQEAGPQLGIENLDRLRVLARQSAPGRPLPPRTPWATRCHGDPTCETCGFQVAVPRERSSKLDKEGSGSSSSSLSSFNLFD
ncbi:hypothetical protein NW762_003368 [Fusarium torreyae]|uniref:2EXR domain-containing protein n=1 Tax=Fusarium torreyae TaxID=1237075 RepID=A0A9W8S8C5_9HYPO|nr:hypothetical protein NW762_003368 [Fusarium torreyae]